MSEADYPGIDYGMGQANIDPKNGIRYGVINMNALHECAWDDFEPDFGEPTCGRCGYYAKEFDEEKHGEYKQEKEGACSDYACENCELVFDSSEFYAETPDGYSLDDGEYSCIVDSYNDVMILKSPYFTNAQFCSPCAPGAGHLEHPCKTGPKTYCFGHDWFDGEKAPYPVYSVKTGELVEMVE
jgi:hypothetical protein